MKIKSIIYSLLAVSVLSLQSCYKDDDKLFDKSSSARMEAALDETREMLVSSEHGWVFEMYPSDDQNMGGYVYTIKFDKEYAHVMSERGKKDEVVSSLWKMTNDSGPVLTFDSYNKLIHEFATPSDAAYQGKKGEFEFMVVKVTNDVITLKGKKTGNMMYMYRLNEPAKDYLAKVTDINDKLILSGVKGTVDGKEINSTIDLDNRQMTFYVGEEEVGSSAYCITSTGLRLFADVDLQVAQVRNFNVSFTPEGATKEFTCEGLSAPLAAQFPEGWQPYGVFSGEYIISLMKSTSDATPTEVPVTLTPDPDGSRVWVSGLCENFDLMMTYNRSLGTLSLCGQFLYEKDHTSLARVEVSGKKYYLAMLPFALPKGASSGSVGYSTSYGLTTQFDSSSADTRFNLVDNGKWSGKKATCFRIYCFTGITLSSTYRDSGASVPAAWRFFGSSTTMYYPEILIKK